MLRGRGDVFACCARCAATFCPPPLHPPAPQGSNSHDWSFFVRMESREEEERYIERVVVSKADSG